MTDDKKPDLYKLFTALLLQILLFPANALIYVKMAGSIWGWFLAHRWGDGPTDGEWFGLSVIYMLWSYKTDKGDDDEAKKIAASPIVSVLNRFVTRWFILGGLFAVAAITGTLLGWK